LIVNDRDLHFQQKFLRLSRGNLVRVTAEGRKNTASREQETNGLYQEEMSRVILEENDIHKKRQES